MGAHNPDRGGTEMEREEALETLQPRLRYRDFRTRLLEIIARKWFVYHRGHLAVAREQNREIALMARLVYGLSVTSKVLAMQKRNTEGVMEYRLYPIAKLLPEDLDEAMAVTAEKPLTHGLHDERVVPHDSRDLKQEIANWRGHV